MWTAHCGQFLPAGISHCFSQFTNLWRRMNPCFRNSGRVEGGTGSTRTAARPSSCTSGACTLQRSLHPCVSLRALKTVDSSRLDLTKSSIASIGLYFTRHFLMRYLVVRFLAVHIYLYLTDSPHLDLLCSINIHILSIDNVVLKCFDDPDTRNSD